MYSVLVLSSEIVIYDTLVVTNACYSCDTAHVSALIPMRILFAQICIRFEFKFVAKT